MLNGIISEGRRVYFWLTPSAPQKRLKLTNQMKHSDKRNGLLGLLLLSAAALVFARHADAQLICSPSNNLCISGRNINMFRDTRSANDVSITQGDRLQFGTEVSGGSLGTTLGAVYPPTGFTVSQRPCERLAVDPNFCATSTGFNLNRLQPWTLIFQKGTDVVSVPGPQLLGVNSDPINGDHILQPVPFPVDVTISGSGTTPTISWIIPDGFVPDGFRVNIYDKRDHLKPDGTPDLIHSPELPNTATSYTLPQIFPDSGLSLVEDGLYTINFQLVETRNHVPFVSNANILRRSSSFFAFSPLPDSAPPSVYLPTVVNGIYKFNVTGVGPGSPTYIDPPVALGYDYATGPGDPNFKSVILPEIGDNIFDLYVWDGSQYTFQASVGSGFNYTFPSGGVNRFRVLGIETGALLDPNNVTAFITGLTFVSSGQFTGTMTPIVASDVIKAELKPGDGPNCVNPKSKGTVPFAILLRFLKYSDQISVKTIPLVSRKP